MGNPVFSNVCEFAARLRYVAQMMRTDPDMPTVTIEFPDFAMRDVYVAALRDDPTNQAEFQIHGIKFNLTVPARPKVTIYRITATEKGYETTNVREHLHDAMRLYSIRVAGVSRALRRDVQ